MSLENRIKTYFVSGAVVLALLGAIIPHPIHYPAPRRVSPPFVPAIMLMAAPQVTEDDGLVPAFSNVVLLDPQRRLFLAVAHGVAESEFAMVISRTHGSMRAYAPMAWRNELADLAIVQVIDPYDFSGIVPVVLFSKPPAVHEVITLHGYCPIAMVPVFTVAPTRRKFMVVKSAADICSNEGSCQLRDDTVAALLEGETLDRLQQLFIYPRFIYGILGDDELVGFEHGLSGSPAFGSQGSVVGVASHYAPFHGPYELAGRHGYFSPAYMAIPLLVRAQSDVDHGTVP